jgi:predicted dehydrogenase
MRVFVVGLGSMGKRRARVLRRLGVRDIIGTDIREDRCREAVEQSQITAVRNFDEGMSMKPDAVVISTPPNLHLQYAMEAATAGVHVFTECNWVEDLSLLDDLDRLCSAKGIVGAASCTQRYQDSVKTMKKLIEDKAIGPIIHIRFQSGQWAPDWHPWESVTDFYLGNRSMGGGREQVSFELNWIEWLLGRTVGVAAMARKLTTLPMDIYDLYQMSLDFESGAIGSVQVDMIQRHPNRTCVLMSEQGQIEWDYTGGIVRVYHADQKRWCEYKEDTISGYLSEGVTEDEPLYHGEMRAYLDAVEGGAAFPYRFSEERELLTVVQAAEQSAATGRYISLDTPRESW